MSFEDALGEKHEIRRRKGLKVKACLSGELEQREGGQCGRSGVSGVLSAVSGSQ